MRQILNVAVFSTLLIVMSGPAFAAGQTAARKQDTTAIKEDRARVVADREKLKADMQAGRTALVRQDKAQLKADRQKLQADGGGKRQHPKKAWLQPRRSLSGERGRRDPE